MSEQPNHVGRSGAPEHNHVPPASSASDGSVQSTTQPQDQDQNQDRPSLGPRPNPNPYPPTPESPDEPIVSNPPIDLSLVIPIPGSPEHEHDQASFPFVGHNNPNSPEASTFPCQTQPDVASSSSSPPHIRFNMPVWPTRDRDDSDVREPDPMPARDPLRLRTIPRPRNSRHGLVRAVNGPTGTLGPSTPVPNQPTSPSSSSSSSSSGSIHDVIRTRSEPDVAAAAQLGLPRLQRIHFFHDDPRSGYHRCRDWCTTNCKQAWYGVKFTFKKPKPDKD